MAIKCLSKPKKKQSLATLRRKCDKALQEAGRRVYKDCLVCGRPQQVLHHYYTKGSCTTLRYEWENLIPLCNGCHFALHNGNPDIQEAIMKAKGKEWLNSLKLKKQKTTKISKGYYLDILETLNKII